VRQYISCMTWSGRVAVHQVDEGLPVGAGRFQQEGKERRARRIGREAQQAVFDQLLRECARRHQASAEVLVRFRAG
jgi:hypothetical protein